MVATRLVTVRARVVVAVGVGREEKRGWDMVGREVA